MRDRSEALPLRNVRIQDGFWSDYIRLVRDVVMPYQWEALNDRIPGAEPSHAIRNFRIAAGLETGPHYGMVFQDSDVAKWLEAAGHLLASAPDAELEAIADEVVDLLALAQQPDGYLNTYFTLKEPGGRWTNLAECHELYCAGHLIEAAVAYSEATGKRKLLDIACKYADYIDSVFGPGNDQLHGYDGHQEIELALIKLYRATGREAYLKLSRYFLDQRGAAPHFFLKEWEQRGRTSHYPNLAMMHDHAYNQTHLPVRQQHDAVGHAVRLVYMCAGMADAAAETGDPGLLAACRRLWDSIASRRMYITGAIGSMAQGEAFTLDYDLPSDTVYGETCASIGLIFFAWRMLLIEPNAAYANVLERALYNTVVSGMSRDGKQFFYVNPLEVRPEAIGVNRGYDHVKAERQAWFGCACCPPNIARLLASLGGYIYAKRGRTFFAHLYIGGEADWELDGQTVRLSQHSDYVVNGTVEIAIATDEPIPFELALRVPDWSDGAHVRIGGEAVEIRPEAVVDGYLRINRVWADGDTVSIAFDMPVIRMKGHPKIRDAAGKTALQRGPFVYCLEQADNGPDLHLLVLPKDAPLRPGFDQALLDGLPVIDGTALRIRTDSWTDALYRPDPGEDAEPQELRFIPYFAWANRGKGEMSVWVRDSIQL